VDSMTRPAKQGPSILYDFGPLQYPNLEFASGKGITEKPCWKPGLDALACQVEIRPPSASAYLVGSPVAEKLTPARGLPEARILRTLARLRPTCSMAAERLRKA